MGCLPVLCEAMVSACCDIVVWFGVFVGFVGFVGLVEGSLGLRSWALYGCFGGE